MTNPAADIPAAVLQQAFRAYCLAKFNYPAHAYGTPEARQQHLDSDVRSYLDNPEQYPGLYALIRTIWDRWP